MRTLDANANMDWWMGGTDHTETNISTEKDVGKWRESELGRIALADDFHISPIRDDGLTYGTPTWIWSVVVDDAVYVRAYHGTASRWYQAAVRRNAGRISVAGMTKLATFTPADDFLNDRINDAYRTKYGTSPYLEAMIGPRARSATIKVMPAKFRSNNL